MGMQVFCLLYRLSLYVSLLFVVDDEDDEDGDEDEDDNDYAIESFKISLSVGTVLTPSETRAVTRRDVLWYSCGR